MSRPVWLETVAAAVLQTTMAPDLDALSGELLREWGSSEVWRLSFGLRSVIVKRGTDTQYAEAAAYTRFVKPMGMPAPELIDLPPRTASPSQPQNAAPAERDHLRPTHPLMSCRSA